MRWYLTALAVIFLYVLALAPGPRPDVCQSPDWPEPTCTVSDLRDYGFL